MVNQKYIALVDCDSFFVSCEQKRNPELKGKPVCVLSNNDGCVISRSKEAKLAGVKMGEPYFMAKKDHPKCIYITAEHDYYSQVSKQVINILKDFSPYVQVYSIDEAFVDFTGLTKLYRRNYYNLAKLLREKILKEADIPVSIGVSSTKTLSKLASDKAKKVPAGIYLIGKRKLKKELQQERDVQDGNRRNVSAHARIDTGNDARTGLERHHRRVGGAQLHVGRRAQPAQNDDETLRQSGQCGRLRAQGADDELRRTPRHVRRTHGADVHPRAGHTAMDERGGAAKLRMADIPLRPRG